MHEEPLHDTNKRLGSLQSRRSAPEPHLTRSAHLTRQSFEEERVDGEPDGAVCVRVEPGPAVLALNQTPSEEQNQEQNRPVTPEII